MGKNEERLARTRGIKGDLNDRKRKEKRRNPLDYEECRSKSREKACKEADKEDGEQVMELIVIVILSALLPIMTITAFVIGYNCNAPKKILKIQKKRKPTKDEIMLERIDRATV